MKIYTIREVAQLAGVSVTTVSRVLNHRPDVSIATRQRVEQVMARCNFVGNANARSLKQQDGETAALILRGRGSPFLSRLAETMLQCAAGASVSFVMETIDEKEDEFQTALRLMHERRATGFILIGSRLDERAEVLRTVDVPLVFATTDASRSGLPRVSSVCVDDYRMGGLAMETLLSAGHRRIAIFGGSRRAGDSLSARYLGARDACTRAGLSLDEQRYVETRFSLADAYGAARAFFPLHSDTTAVFAMSDQIAMGVIRALRDMGRRVPEDVSVFGFDGVEMGKYFIPSLTTIVQPQEEIARKSVEVLLDMMEHDSPGRHLLLEATLARRESVAPISSKSAQGKDPA